MHHSVITYKIIPFESLSPSVLYDILALREEVFTLEQQCTVADLDYLDKQAIHIIGQCDNLICAAARILPPSTYETNIVSFGRLLVKKKFRKKGIGSELMQVIMRYIDTHYSHIPINISAQFHLKNFYAHFGFKVIGKAYDDGGIPHIKMVSADDVSK